MAESRNEATGRLRRRDRVGRHGVPAGFVDRQRIERRDAAVEVDGGVLRDAEEPRPAAEQTRGQGTLHRLRGTEQRDAGGDRCRRETVVGQGDEDRLEHRALLFRGAALCDQPIGELAERDLSDQLAGEVVSEQADVIGVGVAESGPERHRLVHGTAAVSQSRISSLCSPSRGGARW